MTLLYSLTIAIVLGIAIGYVIARWIWRRQEELRREEALEPFLVPIEPLPVNDTDTWIPLGDAANNAVRVAAIFRENTVPPLSEAAE